MEAVCKKLEVSQPTYHRWRQEYGGTKEETLKRLKALEKENGQLKKLVADLSLDKAMLKELVEGAERSETACRRQPAGQRRRKPWLRSDLRSTPAQTIIHEFPKPMRP